MSRLENNDAVGVVDAKTMTVTARYTLGGKGATPAGLALDAKNRVLFVACRNPGACGDAERRHRRDPGRHSHRRAQ